MDKPPSKEQLLRAGFKAEDLSDDSEEVDTDTEFLPEEINPSNPGSTGGDASLLENDQLEISGDSSASLGKLERFIDDHVTESCLRSGKVYKTFTGSEGNKQDLTRPLPSATSITSGSSQPNTNMATPPGTSTGTAVKIITTESSVRKYSGEDEANYSARVFLDCCEAVMTGSGTTSDSEKIDFVKSRIAPQSRAMRLLGTSGLDIKKIGHNYAKFRSNFLRVFSGAAHTSVLKQFLYTADQVKGAEEVSDLWDGTVPANRLSAECMRVLKENKWVDDDDRITVPRMTTVLEVLLYLLHEPRRVRQAAQTLAFKVDEDLADLVSRIEVKLAETDANIKRINALESSLPTEETERVGAVGRPPVTCSFCGRTGHVEKKCLSKKHHLKKKAQTTEMGSHNPPASGAPPTGHPVGTQYPKAPPQYTTYAQATVKPKKPYNVNEQSPPPHLLFCVYHGECHHDTNDCYQLQQIREERARARGAAGNPSGFERKNYSSGEGYRGRGQKFR